MTDALPDFAPPARPSALRFASDSPPVIGRNCVFPLSGACATTERV